MILQILGIIFGIVCLSLILCLSLSYLFEQFILLRDRLHLNSKRLGAIELASQIRNCANWMSRNPDIYSFCRLLADNITSNEGHLNIQEVRNRWEDSIKKVIDKEIK